MGSASITGSGHVSSAGRCPRCRPSPCILFVSAAMLLAQGQGWGFPGPPQGHPAFFSSAERSDPAQCTPTPQNAPQFHTAHPNPQRTPARLLRRLKNAPLTPECPILHHAAPDPEYTPQFSKCTPVAFQRKKLASLGDCPNKGPSGRLGVQPAPTSQAVSPSGKVCHSQASLSPLQMVELDLKVSKLHPPPPAPAPTHTCNSSAA